jgi:Phytanoyl-CoA dioxygenase (PhyH)
MNDILHLPASTSTDAICEAIEQHGGLIVDRLLDHDALRRLDTELAPYLSACATGQNGFAGYRTKRVGALLARSEVCREIAVNPLINAAAAQYLAPYCDSHQLHFTQAVCIGKGEGAQPLHRDRGVWGSALNRSVETQFSTIWALSEFTHANGATQFVPGSHRWDKDRHPTPDEIRYADMAPGSVLLYNGSVLHGGGRNQTDHERTGVLIHYTLNWLRQEENQYLSCPPHIAKNLSPELRALIGYSLGGPVLGFYSTPGEPGMGVELASPTTLFDGTDSMRRDPDGFYETVAQSAENRRTG